MFLSSACNRLIICYAAHFTSRGPFCTLNAYLSMLCTFIICCSGPLNQQLFFLLQDNEWTNNIQVPGRKDHVVLNHKLETIMSKIIGRDIVLALVRDTEGTGEGVGSKEKEK